MCSKGNTSNTSQGLHFYLRLDKALHIIGGRIFSWVFDLTANIAKIK